MNSFRQEMLLINRKQGKKEMNFLSLFLCLSYTRWLTHTHTLTHTLSPTLALFGFCFSQTTKSNFPKQYSRSEEKKIKISVPPPPTSSNLSDKNGAQERLRDDSAVWVPTKVKAAVKWNGHSELWPFRRKLERRKFPPPPKKKKNSVSNSCPKPC